MLDIYLKAWPLFVALIFFVGIILYIEKKLPVWSGRLGEFIVSWRLKRNLNHLRYRILNDLLLPSSGNTTETQIDHVVVSNYGIFCIETKSYEGWIFGDVYREQWTQTLFRYHHNKFFNPIRQNFAHIKALEAVLGNRLKRPIVSMVVFPFAELKNKFHTENDSFVGYLGQTIRKIRTFTENMYSDSERDEIYTLILKANITDKAVRKSHIKQIKKLRLS